MQKKDLKTCKKITVVILLSLLCANLFAYSGMFWGERKLSVAKTKWFDIIYPENCKESAAILFEKADGVYDEVTAQYGLTPAFRMPVVITPSVEQFNAFWTAVPYNHIAIYDTGVSGSDTLAVFSETLLSTFRHELTHAVTYNMKNDFWRFTGDIFGDCVTPGMATVTTGMAEGATVTSESAAGEGRLNDEFAKHYVKQAKIEGKFPSYHDVSGAADVQPTSAPYYFNGAFHGWLQEKYGLEAYADFWFRVVNLKSITISGAFKKAFGVKLTTAWKEFEKDYEVPAVPANPVSAGVARDFFSPDSHNYSIDNDAGSLYKSLSSAKNGARVVWLDQYGGRVFCADLETSKIRQLFAMRGISHVRISNDGRFVAVNYLSENAPGVTAMTKIYDIESGRFFAVKDTGIKDAAIVAAQDSYFLVGQKYAAQRYSVVIYKLNMRENSRQIDDVKLSAEIKMGEETNPFAFTALEDGTFAFLKKERMKWSLCVSTLDGSVVDEFAFEDGMAVHSLSYNKTEDGSGEFCFSYAQKGTLPRAGFMNADTGALRLSNEDISGGVWEPVLWNDEIVYIGQFYRQNRLLRMNDVAVESGGVENSGNARGVSGVSGVSAADVNVAEYDEKSIAALNASARPYDPFQYFARGIYIPVSSYKSDNYVEAADDIIENYATLLGFTYITANPWADNNSDLYTITGSWNPLLKWVGLDLQIKKGTSSSLFSTLTEVKAESGPNGWWYMGGNFSAVLNFSFGRFSTISIGNAAVARMNVIFPEMHNTFHYMLQDVVSLQYSNIRHSGPGRFEYLGFAAGVNFGARYDYVKAMAIGGTAQICIPYLLPFKSKYGYTCNLPLFINASFFPTQSIYGYTKPTTSPGTVIFDATAETILFSRDIQKAIPGITAVYLNDFYFSAGYAGTAAAGKATEYGLQNLHLEKYFESLFNGDGCYFDSVYFKTAIEFTPNVGLFANSANKMGIAATLSYVLHSPEEIKPEDRLIFAFGFDASF